MNGIGAQEICVTTRDGRVRLHQRDGHRTRPGVELLVSHHELRLPAQGSAARPTSRASAAAASARAASTCSSARSTRSISPRGARASRRAGRTSPTATPTPWSSRSTARRPARRREARRGRAGEGEGEGRVRARTCRSAPRTAASCPTGNTRKVELIVNGKVVGVEGSAGRRQGARRRVSTCRSTRVSWVALRHFPQMHTNPVNVIVGGKPIRASRESAQWCIGVIEQLWKVRGEQGITHRRRRTRRSREDVPEGDGDVQEDRRGERGGVVIRSQKSEVRSQKSEVRVRCFLASDL